MGSTAEANLRLSAHIQWAWIGDLTTAVVTVCRPELDALQPLAVLDVDGRTGKRFAKLLQLQNLWHDILL
jgi:hypothetical protein